MKDLSIIIVSYNTARLTLQCLNSLSISLNNSKNLTHEIIVVDNASTDNSAPMLKKQKNILLIENKQNLGYGTANNIGIKKAIGEYILLLNSDATIDNIDFTELLTYMKQDPNIGVLTVRVKLQNGSIDPASHRGFPTIWHSFCYYAKLEKLFGNIPLLNHLFGGYHLTYLDLNTTHEIDSPAGAFYLSPKKVLEEAKGFDESFFMYGEDLDLSYRIKEKGYKVVYYPKFSILHLKHQSGLKTEAKHIQDHTKKHFYNAMKIFYDKHYAQKYPVLLNKLAHFAIDIKSRI